MPKGNKHFTKDAQASNTKLSQGHWPTDLACALAMVEGNQAAEKFLRGTDHFSKRMVRALAKAQTLFEQKLSALESGDLDADLRAGVWELLMGAEVYGEYMAPKTKGHPKCRCTPAYKKALSVLETLATDEQVGAASSKLALLEELVDFGPNLNEMWLLKSHIESGLNMTPRERHQASRKGRGPRQITKAAAKAAKLAEEKESAAEAKADAPAHLLGGFSCEEFHRSHGYVWDFGVSEPTLRRVDHGELLPEGEGPFFLADAYIKGDEPTMSAYSRGWTPKFKHFGALSFVCPRGSFGSETRISVKAWDLLRAGEEGSPLATLLTEGPEAYEAQVAFAAFERAAAREEASVRRAEEAAAYAEAEEQERKRLVLLRQERAQARKNLLSSPAAKKVVSSIERMLEAEAKALLLDKARALKGGVKVVQFALTLPRKKSPFTKAITAWWAENGARDDATIKAAIKAAVADIVPVALQAELTARAIEIFKSVKADSKISKKVEAERA